MPRDRHMTKLTVAFHSYANTSKNVRKTFGVVQVSDVGAELNYPIHNPVGNMQ